MEAKILVVEDEILTARGLETSLMRLGYTVVGIAVSGEEAVAKVTELEPNLILMDIVLPGALDGIEAAEEIYRMAQIPVIYTSAYDGDAVLQRAKASQPFGYLVKPYSERALKATIEVALSLNQAERERQYIIKTLKEQTEAQKSALELRNYLAMAAHEIANSLCVIQGSASMLDNPQLPGFVKQRAVQWIQNAALRMNWLQEDLITLSQTEDGQYRLQITSIELVNLCQQLIETLTAAQAGKNRLQLVSQHEMIVVTLDQRLLNHILKNLLLNALKYSTEDNPVLISLDCQVDTIKIRVQDHGMGIPVDYYPHIFQPFQRADNVSNISGTGLGLTIAKRCVDLLQGKISFHSEIDRGTTFSVTLPTHLG